jgi:hypothetical protein
VGRISLDKWGLLSQARCPDGRNFSFHGLRPGLHTIFCVHRNEVKETSRPGEGESGGRPGTESPL